jgi:Uma2 family endonuclease
MADHTDIQLSAAEYLDLPETSERMELIDGRIVTYGDNAVAPAPMLNHQRAVVKFIGLLDDLIPHGEVFTAPTDVVLDDGNVYQPDVMWVAADSACHSVDGKYLRGAPDLVVEVLSRGTAQQDKVTKFRTYQAAGVREYWIADADERYLEVYTLVDGRFELAGVYSAGETFESPVLGQTVNLGRVFA